MDSGSTNWTGKFAFWWKNVRMTGRNFKLLFNRFGNLLLDLRKPIGNHPFKRWALENKVANSQDPIHP